MYVWKGKGCMPLYLGDCSLRISSKKEREKERKREREREREKERKRERNPRGKKETF